MIFLAYENNSCYIYHGDSMSGKTILCFFIIIGVVLAIITINLLDEFPEGNPCCKDIRHPDNTVCRYCDDYRLHERIIYVWRFRSETNQMR